MIKIRKHYQNLTNENIDRIIKDWQTEIEKLSSRYVKQDNEHQRIRRYQRMILELRTVKNRNQ